MAYSTKYFCPLHKLGFNNDEEFRWHKKRCYYFNAKSLVNKADEIYKKLEGRSRNVWRD